MAESDRVYYQKLRADMARWPIKLLNNIKRRCKVFGIPCTLTVADIKIPTHCPVLGIPIFVGDGAPCDNSPSIDRIDPGGGYTMDNIIVVSQRGRFIGAQADS